MKKLAVLLILAASVLTGCVVAEPGYRGSNVRSGDRDRDGVPNRVDRDRDGDGVRNSQDRYPNDPRRY
jgi:hypothetical protein